MARDHLDIRLTPDKRQKFKELATARKTTETELATTVLDAWITRAVTRPGTRRGAGINQHDFQAIVIAAIRAAGRPLDRTEVIAAVEAAGRRLHGETPAQREQTTVRKIAGARQLVQISGAGYWERSQDCHAASYVAEHG